MSREIDKYNHGVGDISFHVVLVTKYRRRVFSSRAVAARVEEKLYEIAQKYRMKVHALRVLPDHVHLFIGIPPTLSLSNAIQYLKGASAHDILLEFPNLRHEFRIESLWSRGKFFRTVGCVGPETIERYINESQSKHTTNDTEPLKARRDHS